MRNVEPRVVLEGIASNERRRNLENEQKNFEVEKRRRRTAFPLYIPPTVHIHTTFSVRV